LFLSKFRNKDYTYVTSAQYSVSYFVCHTCRIRPNTLSDDRVLLQCRAMAAWPKSTHRLHAVLSHISSLISQAWRDGRHGVRVCVRAWAPWVRFDYSNDIVMRLQPWTIQVVPTRCWWVGIVSRHGTHRLVLIKTYRLPVYTHYRWYTAGWPASKHTQRA